MTLTQIWSTKSKSEAIDAIAVLGRRAFHAMTDYARGEAIKMSHEIAHAAGISRDDRREIFCQTLTEMREESKFAKA